jgi:hypothetical protein
MRARPKTQPKKSGSLNLPRKRPLCRPRASAASTRERERARGPLGALKRARIGDRLAGWEIVSLRRPPKLHARPSRSAAVGSPNSLSAPVLSRPSPCPTKTALPRICSFRNLVGTLDPVKANRYGSLVPMTAPAIRLSGEVVATGKGAWCTPRPMAGSPMRGPSGAMARW